MTDTEMLDWLEEQARKSTTGITFEQVPGKGYRFIRRSFISEDFATLRQAIKQAKYIADGGPFSKE